MLFFLKKGFHIFIHIMRLAGKQVLRSGSLRQNHSIDKLSVCGGGIHPACMRSTQILR